MRPLIDRVQRLQRLAVFEAAGRLGSFTAAASELGMTPPAVTRQIRALERSLGVELFHRTSNRSSLSPTGQRLAEGVDDGFTAVEQVLAELCDANDLFVLAAPPGFAQQLVVPRLDALHDALPDCDIRLWLYDREADIAAGAFDAAVRLGSGTWPGQETHALFSERAVPVATPSLAMALGLSPNSTPEQVIAAPLLHMDTHDRPWMSWSDWLDRFGLALTPGRRWVVHNTYPTVIQQVLAGRGVALGWRGIVDEFIDDGVLVVVGPEVATDNRYCITWRQGRRSAAVDAVISWLSDAE